MPIGNGDITANVWVENGGDLMMLYRQVGQLERRHAAFEKLAGPESIFTPNPFTVGAPFKPNPGFFITVRLMLRQGQTRRPDLSSGLD